MQPLPPSIARGTDDALLRLRALWVAAGWAMVAAIVWVSLTPSPPELAFEQGDKLGHLASYGVLMFWFAQLYGGRARFLYATGFLAMGVALELIQGQLGFRRHDGFDMAANGLGVLLGWAAARLFPGLLK